MRPSWHSLTLPPPPLPHRQLRCLLLLQLTPLLPVNLHVVLGGAAATVLSALPAAEFQSRLPKGWVRLRLLRQVGVDRSLWAGRSECLPLPPTLLTAQLRVRPRRLPWG